jgi:hypothetical protein
MPHTVGFTFAPIPAQEGSFCIQALQEEGDEPVLPSLLGFELKPGTSFDGAWQVAQYMKNHITGMILFDEEAS